MKQKRPWKDSWWLLVLCLMLFTALRLLAKKKGTQDSFEHEKPAVPAPVVVQNDSLLSHPWVQSQPAIKELNKEMVRDLCTLQEVCARVKEFPPEDVEQALMQTLTKLQAQVPVSFPEELYNVICIPDHTWVSAPLPFQVFQRLYLGEMETGLPFYLDVRVFEASGEKAEEVIAWHLNTLDGNPKEQHRSAHRKIYTATGERKHDTAHGFATGQRGLYLDCIQDNERLFVLYAEGSLAAFEKQNCVFKQLIGQIDG
ncbi:MAG: hypothetical protein S4CHLAM2_07270 [Chlamydiales bacterium]|nr:hypothetical protein [Chlamydiales bacterium]